MDAWLPNLETHGGPRYRAIADALQQDIVAGRLTAGQIAERFSCSWPTTTRHLRVLQGAGLVRVERQGREWVYVLEEARLHRVVGGWLRHFETGQEGRSA